MVNYICSLEGKINLVLFSDLIFVCYNALEKHIDLKIFDKVFLSYKEGYLKSEIDAFINVENKLRLSGEDILFIDNNKNNITNANKHGWHTCHAYGYELDKIKESVNMFLNNNLME